MKCRDCQHFVPTRELDGKQHGQCYQSDPGKILYILDADKERTCIEFKNPKTISSRLLRLQHKLYAKLPILQQIEKSRLTVEQQDGDLEEYCVALAPDIWERLKKECENLLTEKEQEQFFPEPKITGQVGRIFGMEIISNDLIPPGQAYVMKKPAPSAFNEKLKI